MDQCLCLCLWPALLSFSIWHDKLCYPMLWDTETVLSLNSHLVKTKLGKNSLEKVRCWNALKYHVRVYLIEIHSLKCHGRICLIAIHSLKYHGGVCLIGDSCTLPGLWPAGSVPTLWGSCAFFLSQGNSHCSPHREARFIQLFVGERSCNKAPPVLITELFMEAAGPATRNFRHGCYGTVPHPLSVWWDGLIVFLPVKYRRWHSHNSAL